MFLNKQDSEYAYTKYAKILNLTNFWIWQSCKYASVSQRSEYARIFLVWQSFEYISGSTYASILNTKVTQGSKYATMWLNISELDVNMPEDVWIYDNKQASEYVHTIHSHSTTYWVLIERYSELVKDLRWSALEK